MRTLIRQNRDPRIDFFRGIALWSMFVDHLINSWFRAITVKQLAFSDSAELFVLLSGMSAGIVYTRILERDGLFAAWNRIVRRVLAIYRTQLILFVLFVALVQALVEWQHPAGFLQFLNLERLGAAPYRSFLDVVLLTYLPKFFDILPLYMVLLLMLCAALPLMRWPRLVLTLSAGLYLATLAFHLALPGWVGFFNPLAWQIVYIIGAVSVSFFKAKHYWRGWDWLAILFAVFSLVESHAKYLVNRAPSALLLSFEPEKPNLHPLRLLAIVSLTWLVWRYVPATAGWLRSRMAEPLVLIGQHSLPVFAASILFAVIGEVFVVKSPQWFWQLVALCLGSMALVGVGALAAWSKMPSRPGGGSGKATTTETERVLVVV
jgi:hypothetical protein